MRARARLRFMCGGFYWPMTWRTGFADVPSSQGERTIFVGPFDTIDAAVRSYRSVGANA